MVADFQGQLFSVGSTAVGDLGDHDLPSSVRFPPLSGFFFFHADKILIVGAEGLEEVLIASSKWAAITLRT